MSNHLSEYIQKEIDQYNKNIEVGISFDEMIAKEQKDREQMQQKESQNKENTCLTKQEAEEIINKNNTHLSDVSLFGIFIIVLIANFICN